VLLPDALRARLTGEIDRLRGVAADVAWVAEANLHVTLKFLGQIEAGRVAPIAEALGAFPTPGRARVVWVGLEPIGPLAAVAAELDTALATLGIPRESRPFAAHVTLGRARESRRNLGLADALARPAECGRLPVTRLSLMRSELHPRGARYTELTSVVLARAASPVE
jgi:RNA 2',3'-cyclic 3'-phosphodiesterase